MTIPASLRRRIGIKEGDFVRVFYDERGGVIKIVPWRRKRTTIRVGKRISVEGLEEAIEKVVDESTA